MKDEGCECRADQCTHYGINSDWNDVPMEGTFVDFHGRFEDDGRHHYSQEHVAIKCELHMGHIL